ncbi:MAG: hypothetical protein IJT29_05460, partial [Oscillospiraceae bacterium]|nr:hypothetical protein [Oscillospiraceae bacterium]
MRTLAWESVLPAASFKSGLYQRHAVQQGETDCHTSDVGHWFAMTRNELCLQSEKHGFRRVFLLHFLREELEDLDRVGGRALADLVA